MNDPCLLTWLAFVAGIVLLSIPVSAVVVLYFDRWFYITD